MVIGKNNNKFVNLNHNNEKIPTALHWFDCLSLAWLLREAALTMFSIVDLIVVFRYCPIWVSSDIDMPVHSLPGGIHRLHQVVSQLQRVLPDRARPHQGPGADLPPRRGLHLPPPVRDPEARPAPAGDQWGQPGLLGAVHLPGDGEQAALHHRAGRWQADCPGWVNSQHGINQTLCQHINHGSDQHKSTWAS